MFTKQIPGAQDKVHRGPASCDDGPASQSELLCLESPSDLAESSEPTNIKAVI